MKPSRKDTVPCHAGGFAITPVTETVAIWLVPRDHQRNVKPKSILD
jgi:hypothetical protein